jgi:hypothetical protein
MLTATTSVRFGTSRRDASPDTRHRDPERAVRGMRFAGNLLAEAAAADGKQQVSTAYWCLLAFVLCVLFNFLTCCPRVSELPY